MKKIKKICQTGLLIFGLMCSLKSSYAQTISNHFFGENAWMPDTIGTRVLNGKLHTQWENIKNSGASTIRFGGITVDENMPTKYQYIKMIDAIRSKGMEPIIQVPFHKYQYTAQQAADIVHYINVIKGKNIKYWIIGNEPDLGYSYTTASQVANYFKPFASAMKNVDPSILIVGPECAWFNKNIMEGLTSPNGPNDITGKDAAGRYYLDVISFHSYPFNGSQTRSQIVSKLTGSNTFEDNLIYLKNRIAVANSAHNRTGAAQLKSAITEANINYQNSSSDNLNGTGVNSFIGGQFVAEMMGIGLKHGLDFINLWSVIEGNSNALNIGYIDNVTGYKKPLYHHFKLMADNFKGSVANCVTNKTNVKSFASKNGQEVSVLIMNQDLTNNYNYTVKLNTSGVSGTAPLKINVDAGIAKEYTDVIPSQSSVLVTFNAAGAIMKKYEYSLTGNAMANLPPTLSTYIATGVASGGVEVIKDLDMKLFPNPTKGKFLIELNKSGSEEQDYEIELFNLIGQVIYKKKSKFIDSKQAMELNESVASGTYIVRVTKGDDVVTKKVLLQK